MTNKPHNIELLVSTLISKALPLFGLKCVSMGAGEVSLVAYQQMQDDSDVILYTHAQGHSKIYVGKKYAIEVVTVPVPDEAKPTWK